MQSNADGRELIRMVDETDVLRSALIQCNDGVRAVRPLDIWVLARRLFLGGFCFARKAETAEHSEAYSINDEYIFNDCFWVSLIEYG